MRADVLVDAGPLVALLDRSDRHHAACAESLRAIRGSLFTVWPVMTEAMYLLGFSVKAQGALLEMVELGTLKILPLDAGDVARIREAKIDRRRAHRDCCRAPAVKTEPPDWPRGDLPHG